MQISELYGAINTDTLEFSDGMVNRMKRCRTIIDVSFNFQLASVMRSYSKTRDSQMGMEKVTKPQFFHSLFLFYFKSSSIRMNITSIIGNGSFSMDPSIHYGSKTWTQLIDSDYLFASINFLSFQLLDDSKILCLANGERISLSGQTRILFEVDSLFNASPATVSRCAMVYLDPTDLGYLPYLNHWYRLKLPPSLSDNGIDYLRELMNFSLEKGLFVKVRIDDQFISIFIVRFQFSPFTQRSLAHANS